MENETNVQGTENTATGQEMTFTQADVDTLIQKRLERERRKYPTDDELAAFRSWKGSREAEEGKVDKLSKERDESRTALAAAQSELEQLKHERYVLSKGVSGEEAEFIAFKAAKLVNDTTTFEQAVDSLTQDKKTPTFDWTAPVGDGSRKQSANDTMNALIRGAIK